MVTRATARAGALVVGGLVTTLCIARASASKPMAEVAGDHAFVACMLSDGGPCDLDAGALDDGAIDSGANDGGALDSGANDGGALDDGAIDDGAINVGDDATIPDAALAADAALPTSDAASGDGGSSTSSGSSSGCGCSVVGTKTGGAWLLFVSAAFAALGLRRKRRAL